MVLKARIVPPSDLAREERDSLLALMARHYDRVRREVFEADLAEKDWVILLEDAQTGQLAGFSTQVLMEATVENRDVRVLFSGDTIVDPEHWGSTALAIAWGKLAFSLLEQRSDAELYWFLTSKGFRTYRFLPVYFREFYPRHDSPTSGKLKAIIDAIASQKYPLRYDEARGIIRACPTTNCLRPGLGNVTDERLHDAHVEFFLRRNPGYVNGDELCCLAPLTYENFSSLAHRLIRSDHFSRQTIEWTSAAS